MTRETLARGLATLGVAFSREVDRETAEVYYAALSALQDAAFLGAVQRAVQKCEFFPPPSKLLDFADGRSVSMVATTDRQLAAMKGDEKKYPTPEQLAEMRNDWRRVIRDLAHSKAATPASLHNPPMTPEQVEARKREIAAQVAARLGEKPEDEEAAS